MLTPFRQGHSISRCKVNKILTRGNLFHTFLL